MKIALFVAQVLLPIVAGGEILAAQNLEKLNQFVQTQTASPAATAFREARDLIKDGEWEKAEARFNRFIAAFPQDREVAAALYWSALAMKQRGKFAAADSVLVRLIQQYPNSAWLVDARAMRVEIAPRLKNTQVIEQGVSEANEEIRLAALQSLFEARPERAVAIAADILKAGNASRLMKEGAIELLEDSETKEAIPVLAQVARTDPDLRLRRKAIEALADIEDDAVIEPLRTIALQSSDSSSARAAMEALADIETAAAQKVLAEVARTSPSVDVRRWAIEALEDRDEDEDAAETLAQLYDSEKDERMKEFILDALGDSETKTALRKLTQIAAGDPSLRLRKRALGHLGESEDPDALKFLEELLKKN